MTKCQQRLKLCWLAFGYMLIGGLTSMLVLGIMSWISNAFAAKGDADWIGFSIGMVSSLVSLWNVKTAVMQERRLGDLLDVLKRVHLNGAKDCSQKIAVISEMEKAAGLEIMGSWFLIPIGAGSAIGCFSGLEVARIVSYCVLFFVIGAVLFTRIQAERAVTQIERTIEIVKQSSQPS